MAAALSRPGIPCRRRVAPAASWQTPNATLMSGYRRVARSRPAHLGRMGAAMTSARFSAPRAAWTRHAPPTSRRLRSPRCPAGRRRPLLASGMWAWPRSPTSGTSLMPRFGTSLRASHCAGSLIQDPPLAAGLVTLAWIRQASGDPEGAREAMARPSGSRRTRRAPAQPRPGAAGAAAAVPGRPRRRCPLDAGERPGRQMTSRITAREPGHLVLARVLLAQDQPGRGAGAAGPAARGGGRAEPDRQPDRDRRAAGAGAGRQR